MKKSVLVLGLLVMSLAILSAPAMAIGNDNVIITDRDRLWNPLLGQAPWATPVGYTVAAPAATTVAHDHGAAVVHDHSTVSTNRTIVHYTRGANIDRNLLWNPLMGTAPWCDAHDHTGHAHVSCCAGK